MPLREVAGQVLILGGSAIFLFEFVRLTRSYVRLFRERHARPAHRKAASIARLEHAYWASKHGVVGGAGVTLTFLGLVMTERTTPWILAAPIAICLAAAGNILLFRWALRRLRGKAERLPS